MMIDSYPKVKFEELRDVSYKHAWDYQQKIHQDLISDKLNRKNDPSSLAPRQVDHHLIFCEHNPVFTLGKSGSIDHLLLNEGQLIKEDIEFFKINRGGDITYHGPGQITGYPIFDLDEFFTDVHKYVRFLEESVIRTLSHYGIEGSRIPKYTGVWVGDGEKKRKICAIGVHLSRWVTMHGFAFNVNTDLSYFDKIIPCGINDKDLSVTSVREELNRPVEMKEIKDILKSEIAKVFNIQYI